MFEGVALMRSNEEWLAALGDAMPDEDAVAELQGFLRRGLTKVLADRTQGLADLEDFVQDGTLRVIERLKSFRGDSRFTTWALSVAIRVAFTELRRKRWKDLSLGGLEFPPRRPVEQTPDPTLRLEKHELLEALRNAIDTVLTDRQREVVLAKVAGTPGIVLADRLRVKPNALYKMYHDARKKLQRALNEAGFSNEIVRSLLARASNIR
jgi:RNA polymerase sigma-70 factor (ECF subfamily)